MSGPFGLFAVDGEVDVYFIVMLPFLDNFFVIDKILHTAGAVDHVYPAVIIAVMAAIVYYRAERGEPDTAGDKEKILALEFVLLPYGPRMVIC